MSGLKFLHSLIVANDQQPLTHQADTAVVEANNTNDFFTTVKLFASSSEYEKVTFWRDANNRVILTPDKWDLHSKIDARFTSSDQFRQLPNNYIDYKITIGANGDLSSNDINAIFQWKLANDIKLYDESGKSDIVFELLQRASEFNTKNLKYLSFTLQSSLCNQNVASFFDSIERLKSIEFYGAHDLSDENVQKFVETQRLNKQLQVDVGDDGVITVMRRHKLDKWLSGAVKLFTKRRN